MLSGALRSPKSLLSNAARAFAARGAGFRSIHVTPAAQAARPLKVSEPFEELPLPTPEGLRRSVSALPDTGHAGSLNESVLRAMKSEIELGRESAFFICDLDTVQRKYEEWTRHLPRIQPFYAMSCNPDRMLVTALREMGAGFGCMTLAQLELALWAGAEADSSVLFGNLCKTPSSVRAAAQSGVSFMTFDDADELLKLAKHAPGCSPILRIRLGVHNEAHAEALEDLASAVQLDAEAPVCQVPPRNMLAPRGASVEDVPFLAATASRLGLRIGGVSFHVGSASARAEAYEDGVVQAAQAFQVLRDAGHSPSLLDVGGGFPEDDTTFHAPFASIADSLTSALEQHFPDPEEVRVVAEPGRFLVGASHTLAVAVVAKRYLKGSHPVMPASQAVVAAGGDAMRQEPSFMYYLSDGVYGAFTCAMLDPTTAAADTGAVKRAADAVKTGETEVPALPRNSEHVVPLDFAVQVETAPRPRVLSLYPAPDAAAADEGEPAERASRGRARDKYCVPLLSGGAEDLDDLHERLVGHCTHTEGINRGTQLALETHREMPPSYGATTVVASPPDAPAGTLDVGVIATGPVTAGHHRTLHTTPHEDVDAEEHAADEVKTRGGPARLSTLWGPRTDSIEAVVAETWLPELETGDFLYFRNMGAYTSPASSAYNSIHAPPKVYLRNGTLVWRHNEPEVVEKE
mmetsp:Transcript_4837/g.15645  ORF Transcript_4837/g.15645 Transcript_4837/m.15645 type:complete len:689 (-) Transcript_4837:28-2094(-)